MFRRRTKPFCTVSEEAEGTYPVDLELTYSDGDPVQGATYTLTNLTSGVFEDNFDNKGKASVSGVVPGELKVEYGEDTREFIRNQTESPL